MSERIQKLLATTGIASRRAIETMIAEGRVTVNGRPAEAGQRIDHNDHVRIDTRLISLNRKPEPVRVLLYRKKTGELVTRDDPEGRRTVFRKLPELTTGRWIAIGRLDINTSGLLLMTNDGELARRLMHPSFEMQREYAVRVLGTIDSAAQARLRAGVELEDGFAKFETIKAGENHGGVVDDEGDDAPSAANSWWTVTVKQGRNRVVRRLFESQNTQVSRLMRVSYGPISLGRGIKAGTAREATPEELQALLEAVDLAEKKTSRSGAAKKKPPTARRRPAAEASERPAPTHKPRRSPRAAAEAERKREFFDRGDGAPAAAGKAGPKREFKPGAAKPGAKREFRRDEGGAAAPKREFTPGRSKPGAARPAAAGAAKREFRKDEGGAGAAPKREFKPRPNAGAGADARREPRREDRPKSAAGANKPRSDSRKPAASSERAKPAPRRGESKPYVKPDKKGGKPRRK